ncbi:hypothetical protein SHI21_18965 [Bacteriovorax sp. PP10]|uniref:Alginate export domain-containing protein n=1 Tax=Bacteriovorax antarcticus TaxID=3088717 RepID=A0ABU5VZ45_9BACT|nr:hypothetical protein [Bacteriovorax sp. PP10]MEA9358324.1 hypothetical protein [Bacteriovorax sp. PP10]
MFSKLTLSLAVTMSLLLAHSAQAQTKKVNSKKANATAQAKTDPKAEEAKAADAAAKKAAEEKALEAKRAEEAKAAAEKAKLEDQAGVYGYIKSHFSASYHGEYYFTRKDVSSANSDDHDIQDLKIMHNPTITYRPFTNWKLLATSEFKYTDAEAQGSFINRHYRSLVLLTRENVLTEKENGIKMDIGVGRRIFDRNHGAQTSYGNNRINTSLSKKFGEKLSTSLLAQYLANDPAKGKITNKTWKHSLELIPSFTYQITDKITYFFNDDFILNSAWQNDTAKDFDISHEMNIGYVSYQYNDKNSSYFQFKYLHVSGAAFQEATKVDDWFEYYIGHTYSFTPKLSLTGEVGSKIFGAHDGKDFFANEVKYPEFAIYFDYAL